VTTNQRSIEIVVGLARGWTRVPLRTRATGSEVLPEQALQDPLAGLGPQDIRVSGRLVGEQRPAMTA
jgi:hypothetical protein